MGAVAADAWQSIAGPFRRPNFEPQAMQKSRFAALPAMMFAVGLGMAMYNGYAWRQLPDYNAEEIEQSVDLNLALDFQRRGTPPPADEAEVRKLRNGVRQELLATIERERTEVKGYAGTGLILAAVGLAQMILMRRMAAR